MNDDMLVKYLLGEADEREAITVKDWLNADANHVKHYEQLKAIWDESVNLATNSQVDEDAAWSRFDKRIQQDEAKPPVPVKRFYKRWMQIAASIVLVFALGWLARSLVFNNSRGELIKLMSNAEVLKETLPDGSVVTLNRNSSLSYPSGFKGDTRSVILQGEAFFNIEPDKSKPFIVQVNDVEVMVTGTSFNIKSREGQTEVIVETGVVQVSKLKEKVELRPGDKVIAMQNTQTLIKKSTENQLYQYYRTKKFVCEATPLSELVKVLEEAYNTDIVIVDESLKQLPITTVFKNESLDGVLKVIAETFDISIEHQENRILLKR